MRLPPHTHHAKTARAGGPVALGSIMSRRRRILSRQRRILVRIP
jgi:hypothetical protein